MARLRLEEQQGLMRPLRVVPDSPDLQSHRLVSNQSVNPTDLESYDDNELLQTTELGNAAFTIFYRRNIDAILTYFWQRTRDHEVTADLTSETFAIALENIDKFNPTRGNGAQWLHGIAANLLKKFWRRNKATGKARQRLEMEAVRLEDPAAKEIEAIDAQLDGDRLNVALQQVPAKNRRAVHLRLVENLGYDQIADRLGCTPGAARVRVLRGLRHLQHEFDRPLPTRGGTS